MKGYPFHLDGIFEPVRLYEAAILRPTGIINWTCTAHKCQETVFQKGGRRRTATHSGNPASPRVARVKLLRGVEVDPSLCEYEREGETPRNGLGG